MRMWTGGYTADMDGNAAGIGLVTVGEANGTSVRGDLSFVGTAVSTASPSWLTQHPSLDVVYAALEGDGAVRAFRRAGEDALVALGPAQAVGESTCHVAVSPDARWLVTSSYADGAVARYALNPDGSLGEGGLLAPATDPYAVGGMAAAPAETPQEIAEREALRALRDAVGPDAVGAALATMPHPPTAPIQILPARKSHAHQARFLPDGIVATTDLGFDLVRFWRGGTLLQEVALPYGCGPRHMVWHPSGHLYVLTEYSCEVFGLSQNEDGSWRIVTAAAVSRETTPTEDFGAELSLSDDGEYLYAGLRGINALAVLRVRAGGERLEAIATVDTNTNWPRHHLLLGDTMFVAGERANEVVSLSVDEHTRIPGRLISRAHVPTPTVLLPAIG